MFLNYQQVKSVLSNAGFKGINLDAALRIAYCESSYNSSAHNTINEDSRGLMQINVAANANPQYSHLDLFDPQVNANVAYEIFTNWGNNYKAWTCARQLGLVNPIDNLIIPVLAFGLIIAFIAIRN